MSRKTVWKSLQSDLEIQKLTAKIYCLTHDRVGTVDRPGEEGSFNTPTMSQLLSLCKTMKRDSCLTISGPAPKINSRWLTDRVTHSVSWTLFQSDLSHSQPNGRRVHFVKAQSTRIPKGEMDRIFPFAWRTSVPESPWADCERPDHSAES